LLRSDVECESRQKKRKRQSERDGRCIVAGAVVVGIAGSPIVSVPRAVTVTPVSIVISMAILVMTIVVVVTMVAITARAVIILPGP
jgi:hypothetical protein